MNQEEYKTTSVLHPRFHHHHHRNGERNDRFPNPNGLHPRLATPALFKMVANCQILSWIDSGLRIKDSSKGSQGMLPVVHITSCAPTSATTKKQLLNDYCVSKHN